MNPVARLFGSLANALLDLGLPTIRQWLRDRIGPAADVALVTTDGSLVHLDGVKIPVGPKGLLVLERATVLVTALGRAGLPELRLHAFTGVLAFGDGSHWFRADVSFTSASVPDESAWISGDLTIRNVTWAARVGSPKTNPMNGHARLFVSSSEWRIEGGRLDGEIFRGRFAGTGRFDAAGVDEPAEADRPLVPPALATAALALEHAHVGPFLDAASGLGGKAFAVPSFIPLDAELDGELSWSVADGARAEVRVASEAIRATLRGAVGPNGRELTGRIDAHLRPAVLLRGLMLPREAVPREEDTLAIALDVGGTLREPEVNATAHAAELGFRLGRPRFVPAVLLHDVRCEAFLKDDRAVVRAVALARSAKVTLDLDANIRRPLSARGTLRADILEPAFLRDVVRTLGLPLSVPEQVRGAIDLTLAPADDSPASRARLAGGITLSTPSSKLTFEASPERPFRIVGGVTAADVLATDVMTGTIVPLEGDVVVALDVEGPIVHGTVGSSRLVLGVRRRPELPPHVLEGVSVEIALDREALAYDQLRFRAHGASFVGKGRVPFAPDPSSVLIDLELVEGGAELAEALARLARRSESVTEPSSSPSSTAPDAAGSAARFSGDSAPRRTRGGRFRIAREGARPPEELWLPSDLTARGRLRLAGDLSLTADVQVETARGTALDLALVLAKDGRLDGTALHGTVAIADAITSGVLGSLEVGQPDASDRVDVDAVVGARTATDSPWLVGFRSERLAIALATTPLVLTKVSGALRIDGQGAAWHEVQANICGGLVTSSGISRAGELHARVSASRIAVHELPTVAGHEPSSFVRGRLSGTVIARTNGESLHAAGDVMLDDAAFPALDLLRPELARYGLRPPNEDAAGPATATIVGTDWGVSLREVKIDLRGATLRGEITLSRERKLDGRAEVTLDEEYLRTSKVLTLPRVLTDHLVLPVRIEGPLEHPHVHAGIAELLGRFLKDNRVSAFVTSAVEEAQHLLGRPPVGAPDSRRPPDRAPHEQELDAILRRALDVHAADWQTIARRRMARDGRYRVG